MYTSNNRLSIKSVCCNYCVYDIGMDGFSEGGGCLHAKYQPSIFGTLAKDKSPAHQDSRRSIGPQMMSLCHMFRSSGDGYDGLTVDENDALIFQDGNLLAGSLDALIRHLVPTAEYYPDRTYTFAFLLSSRLYARPHELLKEVCKLCKSQQHLEDGEKVNKEKLGKFGPNIIQLLGEWTEMLPYDFRDERMMKQLKEITQKIVTIYPELRKEVGMIMHDLITKLSSLQKYEEALQKINAEATQRLKHIVPTTDIVQMCPSPLDLAQQLTHIELERLTNIGPEEFVQAFAKENELQTSYDDMKKTSNLEAYVQWFNRLSYLVATEICMHLKKKHRVRTIEYFVDVAKECFNIGNFNSLMAIIAGMNMSPVARLKKTWSKVNTQKFEILEHQMDPSNNFSSYRSTLKAALWRCEGAVEEREKIVIPFFSLLVKDIYFLNEGCANRLPNGHINFEKFWQLAKQITEFITWKQVECPFERQSHVLNYVLTNPVFSENSLSLASFECEPPENSYEKERYKNVKSEMEL
ncbi:ras-GEF domain-containing family member 1B isoform X2 [Lingula anatina]|uniref:Ras-GEF domain-containing family member 1B isoform X2 n=1 Tax=Lingula anatina TaxID=7574 RepID=A0A1S3IXU6_LINAN|nr:ras-GEF domain-containing family member 1B isoform X2 [Lingula anatina]|eukprot:XP_013402853.1 ras-GEF domain-containing family member 1B isoform X2 [Lingula anatina]